MEVVVDGLVLLLAHQQVDLELLVVLQRAAVVALGVHTRPADHAAVVVLTRMDDGAERSRERVFTGLHVLEEIGEVHDAGHVGFVELNATAQAEFVGHG